MELCTPLIKDGGCDTVYVMPNLQPPITRVSDAVSYQAKLSRLAPGVTFLMSLFLHPGLNAAIIAEAARTKIIYGVNVHLTVQRFLSMMYSLTYSSCVTCLMLERMLVLILSSRLSSIQPGYSLTAQVFTQSKRAPLAGSDAADPR